jgi:GNAT superfamily N-acetyltransferase
MPTAAAAGAPADEVSADAEAEEVQRSIGIDSLLIERATLAHVPYLVRLKQAVMSGRYLPAADAAEIERWREMYCTEAYFRELIEQPDAMLLCIGSLRDPVGMVVLHRRSDHLEVDDLLCLYPRRGDGSRLLTACLRYAEAWRIQDVVIDVYPGHENAGRFLERHGFSRSGPSSNDLGHPMERYVRKVSGA